MVNTVQPTNPYAGRPTTLGEKLLREARQELKTGGRVVEDRIDVTTTDLSDGTKAVNFSHVTTAQSEVRNADAEKISDALDRGLRQGAKAGELFRRVFRGLFAFFKLSR